MSNKIKVAINGLGRIGRVAVRSWWENYRDKIEIVAVNTSGSMDIYGWGHLLKYDSNYGRFPAQIEPIDPRRSQEIGRFRIGDKEIACLAERNPAKIRWNDYDVDVVLECTGAFRNLSAQKHLKSGAGKVIISAPAEDIPIYLLGVNHKNYNQEALINMGSCTTNCVTPIIKEIDQVFGFDECIMTTIHAMTSSQNIVDGSHKDLRRARAGASNIVPTGTGAAKAVMAAYPEVIGRFAASAIRVPVLTGSYSELIFKINQKTTINDLNEVLEKMVVREELVGIVKISYEPLVSSDIVGNSASAIIDIPMTEVLSDDMIKISAWYDNEYGYASRLLEMAEFISLG